MTPCTHPGCEQPAVKSFPFCKEHVHRSGVCTFDGCSRTIAAYNRSGYCYDHRWYPQKLKRAARKE